MGRIAHRDTQEDKFFTVEGSAADSLLVSGSKFIAHLAPAESVDTVEQVLHDRRRRYPDATHHCWAGRVGRPGALIEKSSDAGEPSGTAGRPILDALRRGGLENVVCVVTRYFGGTKLGTGGLARAYGDAAERAIAAARIVEQTIVQRLDIQFDHQSTGTVYRVLEEFGLVLVPGAYDTRAHGTVQLPHSQVERVCARLAELRSGEVEYRLGELGLV